MRKALRLGLAALLAAPVIMIGAGNASAGPTVVECDPSPVPNPGVTVPDTVPVVGGVLVLGPEDPCLEAHRTLVFVGNAQISNGVNFAGLGDNSQPRTRTPEAPETDSTFYDGTYVYTGQCVMVNWTTPANSGAAVNPLVTDCTFGTTDGEYHDPNRRNPVLGPVGAAIEDNSPGETGMRWGPGDQPSCSDSSGTGSASFISKAPVQAVGAAQEQWVSSYSWTNGLSNLRGSITGPEGTFAFDAKIEAQADPRAADPLDKTAAGCLQKTANALIGNQSNANTGLNSILIVGTATWNSTIPETI